MHEPVPDLWNDADCSGFSEPQLLLYRSRLLGSDLRITNFGGGNTSAKVRAGDPLTGQDVEVLWVKGSGGDLGSMALDGFATLYLDKLRQLRKLYRGKDHEDEMVGFLPHCTFDQNPRPASIDTPLHGLLPFRHIDHLHPDSVIAIAACQDGERATREIFGGKLGWLPWQRPGFELGVQLAAKIAEQPALEGIVLGGHGLMTWGDTAKACYLNSLDKTNRAAAFLRERNLSAKPFGDRAAAPLPDAERQTSLTALLPMLRGCLAQDGRKIAHVTTTPEVMEFVGSQRAKELAALGTSCPDHFLRTKRLPLFLDGALDSASIAARLDAYRRDYAAYYERCKRADSPALRDPDPVVVLLPGLGMVTFAKSATIARQAAEFYQNAIQVLRGAILLGGYQGLPEQEAFDIEYWALEEAKLRRMPPEKSLARRIVIVTGAAGGIGKAVAKRLLGEHSCVLLTDIDQELLAAVGEELRKSHGQDSVHWLAADITVEQDVVAVLGGCVRRFGGVDGLVCSAGLASAAAIEDTSTELWQRNLDVLATGYFLPAREAYKVLRAQGLGGSIVFVGSKNALAASPQAAAYCTAKAAALHLARCMALEGAPFGIRVNTVNPDAVLKDSRIWAGTWRQERAAAYGVSSDALEEHYRKRSLLQRPVLPEDIAEAVYWFASDLSAKSTGNVLNVDAGNATAFPR
jgi:rhamnulose-1-phosphate aldolase/alcohol dehydrogenase